MSNSCSLSLFAFLDSSYVIPQHLQLLSFRAYAHDNDSKIAFYAAELCGTEGLHLILNQYAFERNGTHYLFFSIRQFITNSGLLDLKLVSRMLDNGLTLHFSNEMLKITHIDQLFTINCLLLSSNPDNYKPL